jgi:hypothetical protein
MDCSCVVGVCGEQGLQEFHVVALPRLLQLALPAVDAETFAAPLQDLPNTADVPIFWKFLINLIIAKPAA